MLIDKNVSISKSFESSISVRLIQFIFLLLVEL